MYDTLCADIYPTCGEGACCYGDGTCAVSTQATCEGAGGVYQGGGTDCDPNPCPQPGDDCGNPVDLMLPEICGDFTNDGVVDSDDYWFIVDAMVTCLGGREVPGRL